MGKDGKVLSLSVGAGFRYQPAKPLENIRLISNGEVLFYGTPESVTIEVIDQLLVTEVTARPLTADEIREKGIVFDQSNFQAYNW